MTEQTGGPTSVPEKQLTPGERAKAIEDEIAEAEELPDPTLWDSFGRQNRNQRKDG
jgi:hypothetical protein